MSSLAYSCADPEVLAVGANFKKTLGPAAAGPSLLYSYLRETGLFLLKNSSDLLFLGLSFDATCGAASYPLVRSSSSQGKP